jgi:hypothetical protein
MSRYLFNAPPHHTIKFSEDEIYHGGDELELASSWGDPRLIPIKDVPEPVQMATPAPTTEKAEEPKA